MISTILMRVKRRNPHERLLATDELVHIGRGAFVPWRRKIATIFQDPFNSLNPRNA